MVLGGPEQHREREFARAALVVARREGHELPPSRRKRRNCVQHIGDGFEFDIHRRRPIGSGPNDARYGAPPQRHAHQRSRGKRLLTQVVEPGVQSGMLRRLDKDTDAVERHAELDLAQIAQITRDRLRRRP